MHLESYTFAYGLFRFGWVTLALLGCWALWRRPRPARAFALILGLFLAAWAAYRLPLIGSCAMTGLDRRFNVGSAACVAAGHSPWGNAQVGTAALEPFWDVVAASLALFNPARVMYVYEWLSPLVIVLVAFGVYFGLRDRRTAIAIDAGQADAWKRLLIVLAVLGLSSFSLSSHTPIQPFFVGNFLFKPNHAAGFGLFAVVLGLAASAAPFWAVGLVLGLLAWVLILHWGYALPTLVLAELLRPRAERRWPRLAAAIALSGLVALPQILNLRRDYSPTGGTVLSSSVWSSGEMAQALAPPYWMTLDLGLLLVLAVLGVALLLRRRTPVECGLLATLAFAFAANAAQSVLTPLGISPEVDELHYFLHFAAALVAGVSLARFGELLALRTDGPVPGRSYLLVLAACIPLTFPAYWDPSTMDKRFPIDVQPLPEKSLALAAWIREHTQAKAVFFASFETSTLIPALTGRRVLLVPTKPPADYPVRQRVGRILLRQPDAEKVRRAAAVYGVTHVVVDREMREEYAVSGPASAGAFELAYEDRNVSLYALRTATP